MNDEPRIIPPTPEVKMRRERQANGKPIEQGVDTIGRIWAFGLLEGLRHPADQLRDAGRRYAIAYWWRLGPVCAHSGHYSEMVGRGAIGETIIIDPFEDEISEEKFNVRRAALNDCGLDVRREVEKVTVDNHGDGDPVWLSALINGYPVQTVCERYDLGRARMTANDLERTIRQTARTKRTTKALRLELAAASRAVKYREKNLRLAIIKLRESELPSKLIGKLRLGLLALADIDEAEGMNKSRENAA